MYTYLVQGHGVHNHTAGALFLRHGTDPDEELDDHLHNNDLLTSIPHSITFGQPFSTGVLLQAVAGIGLGETGEYEAAFSATFTGLEVFDSAMNPIGQFTVASLSGTPYPLPAPGGIFILAGGMMFARRRRSA